MPSKSFVRLIAALFFLALPASAGTLYLPVLGPEAPADASYQTRVWLTNHGGQPAQVTTVRMRGVVDGTRERARPLHHRIAPGATLVLNIGPAPGLLEIRAPRSVAVSAELRNVSLPGPREVFGSVPVIGSGEVAPGGTSLTLQGLRRSTAGVRTHLGVINLGHRDALCDVEVRGVVGGLLGKAERVPVPALSHLPVDDFLELFDVEQVGDAQVVVSCSRPFYAYAASSDVTTGETVFLEPAATGASTLAPPGDQAANEPPSGGSGGSGAQDGGKSYVFARNGLVHSPTRNKPTWTHNVRVPGNTDFSKIVLELDVTPGPWDPREPQKMHNLFWLHRGGCCWPKYNANVIGYANAFGPGKGGNQVKVTHNLGRSKRPFPKLKQGFRLHQGTTYRLRYLYDAAAGRISLRVFSQGKLLFETTDRATVKKIRSDASGEFMVYLGHTPHKKGSGAGPERPTFGWQYANLKVELFR